MKSTLVLAIFFSLTLITNAEERLALIQYSGDRHFGDKAANRAELEPLIFRAAAAGARIIVLPEGAITGYETENAFWSKPESSITDSHFRDVNSIAEEVPAGETVQYYQAISEELGIILLVNLIERSGDQFYNSLVIIRPQQLPDVYRKRRLWHVDQHYAQSGDRPYILETEFGRFGLMICYDVFSQDQLEEYQALGIEDLIVSMHWPTDKIVTSRNWVRSRARKHQLNFYVADQSLSGGTGFYSPEETSPVAVEQIEGSQPGERIVLVNLSSEIGNQLARVE